MKVRILKECGYAEALLGLSLSYDRPIEDMPPVAEKLCAKDDSESKFLRFIVVWLDIVAPRYWWCQMDTYHIGKEQQSESTMHTVMKRPLTIPDFATPPLLGQLEELNDLIARGEFYLVKSNLPEGFLQRRIVVTNYQTLRRIIRQRHRHKLPEWQILITTILDQIEHGELLCD